MLLKRVFQVVQIQVFDYAKILILFCLSNPKVCLLFCLSHPLSLLGGWLSVYAPIRCAPSWGPTFYCIDRCRYSFPFWPAAAGERSVPLSQYLCSHMSENGMRHNILFLLGSLPALAKGQTVICLVLLKYNRGEERLLLYTHFPTTGVSVFPHYATAPCAPVTSDLSETVNKWHQRPNGKEPVVV